jgi:uncharacterized damage-inducible protein DinB
MNTREYFVQCFKGERPKFLRVLQAVPADKAAYRPHPKSMSAGDIAALLAGELHDACEIFDKGQLDFEPPKTPDAVADSVAAYDKNAAELEKRAVSADDAKWATNAKFLMGGKVAWEAPLGDMLWGFLFDAIHHRGQLSTYLRPMGAKVPSIYGPSGDDPGT